MTLDCIKFPKSGDYEHFIIHHLQMNKPCLFEENATHNWKARKNWQINGQPNFDYLVQQFGDITVPVADCNVVKYSTHSKSTWKFRDFINYWKLKCSSSDSINSITDAFDHRMLYLKDWHFVSCFPGYNAYSVLPYFSSDWLNEEWQQLSQDADDYCFVYMGPRGSWTPFHADVFRSYSWSANICGVKEWLLYPPGEENLLRDSLGNLPLDVTSDSLTDRTQYHRAHLAKKPLRVIQGPGEVIFVPSGWYHQVKNLEDTISINHNWTNAFGIQYVWSHLKTELILVRSEIADCKGMEGWEEQCQLVLRASAGMDFSDLHNFLLSVAEPRLKQLERMAMQLNKPEHQSTTNSELVGVLETSLHPMRVESPTSLLPLQGLLTTLPDSIQTALQQLAQCCEWHKHQNRTVLVAAMIFTCYELHKVNGVLQELTSSTQNMIPTSSRDYVVDCLKILRELF